MTIDMSQFYDVFFEETEELLAEKERLLLNMDRDDPSMDDIDAIFRAAHSIKGGASTFGFTDMADVTHVMESILDKIRRKEMILTAEHVETFLIAKDVIKMLRDGHQHGTPVDQEAVDDVVVRLEALSNMDGEGVHIKTSGSKSNKPTSAAVPASRSFLIDLPKMPDDDAGALINELGMLGEVKKMDSADESHIRLQLVTKENTDDILSICSFMMDPDQVEITENLTALEGFLDELGPQDDAIEEAQGYGFFDNISSTIRRKENDSGNSHDQENDDYGFFDPPPQEIKTKGTMPADAKTPKVAKASSSAKSVGSTSIRVGVEKVDQLINLVGELVITQAMVQQRTSNLDSMHYQKLMDSINQLARNTRDLQEAVMSMRMMQMDYVFSRYPRMVHDLATKLGKKIELVTLGSQTELDKGLIERIIDPLTHLVRNSVDHGIELPEVRKASGKSEIGKLMLSASHQGGNIVIEVSDDGSGLNRERILSKAKEKGFPVSDTMPDSEVWDLIFAPGFSTADVVTDVSGRGVGMDVVKRNIVEMGGFIDIRSAQGMGTILSVFLPLTLAILDGMSVRTGDEIHILPLDYVVESLQPVASDIKEINGQGRVLKVRGEYLPILPMYELFAIESKHTNPVDGIIVILEADGNKAALLVDELVGQQQVVVKNLESNYKKVPGISGATIMGDGEVALILDVSGLLRSSSTVHGSDSMLS